MQGIKILVFFYFEYNYLAMYKVKFFEFSFTDFYTSLVKDPIVRFEKKKSFQSFYSLR